MDRPGRTNKGWAAAGALCCCLLSMDCQAGVTLDGSLGTAGPLAGPDYLIPAGVGRRLGGNLFHSFDSFSIGKGQSATFTGPAAVSNIISRVTGGAASNIDGTLRSGITGANLYLINPAGVVFGPNATLDIGGSFHASTADYLGLGKTGCFDASTPAESVLTSAPPSAFGFLGAKPAPIRVDGSFLRVPPGQGISLIGGDVSLPAAVVYAPGGRINVAALASGGVVEIAEAPTSMVVSVADKLGEVRMDGGLLSSAGDGGGSVIVRAGRFLMENQAIVSSSAAGPTDGSILETGGAGVDIDVAELILDTASIISSNVLESVAQPAPPLRIKAGRVEVMDYSSITSGTLPGSIGSGSQMRIEADSIDIHHGGRLKSTTQGTGTSSDLKVGARELKVRDGGQIYTEAYGGTGKGGNLIINAQHLLMSSDNPEEATRIGSYSSTTTGNAADIRISADSIEMSAATEILSQSTGVRDAGNIDIQAREISITGMPGAWTGIFANAYDEGNGGTISIVGESLQLSNHASIASWAVGNGHGGNIRLTGNSLRFSDFAELNAAAKGHGDAGNIILAGGTIAFEAESGAYAYAQGPSNPGNITLNADAVVFSTGAGAHAFSSGPDSGGGNIEINAKTVSLVGYGPSWLPLASDFTGLNAQTVDGPGGSIRINASEKATFANRARVTSSSIGAGRAGDIEIDVPVLEIRDGAQILSSAYGTGVGGDIRIDSGDMLVSGVYPEAYTDFYNDRERLDISGIGAQSLGSAPAGQVTIQAGKLRVMDGAGISTETFGAGAGGNVTITAEEVLVSGRNAVLRAFFLDQGVALEIASESAGASISVGSSYSDRTPTGDGGNVNVNAGRVTVMAGGLIKSDSMGAGKGGNVSLDARDVLLGDGGMITARGTGSGPAGSLRITASERFSNTGGLVSTESESAGGGGIAFRVGEVFHLADGAVTTSVRGGGGDAGNIDIDPRFVVLNNGHIAANAHGGTGGNIRIVSDYFLTSGASVVEASSTLGVDGSVRIESVETQVTDGLEGPRAEYLDASALLRPRCAARAPGQASTFTVSGRGGLPPDPERPAWSTYSGVIDPADKPDAGRDSAESRVESRVESRTDAACRG